jgi:L-seryl-tRNA(Ser) seleniumtransferase
MAEEVIQQLRDFPSVEELLSDRRLADAVGSIPRPLASELVKAVVARNKAVFEDKTGKITAASLLADIRRAIGDARLTQITRVINATGIVVHTNLGRAPLSEAMFEAVTRTVTGSGNVEVNLADGRRGDRGAACESYLALLAGAESATVVNNCAAALFMILNTLANRREVLVSRGELVQIGGGFRIPDILRKSGAKLCEVGSTNITTADDYRSNLQPRTALILKVHKSNFAQTGFAEEVSLKGLVTLAREHDLPVVNDLGSGVFVPTGELLGYTEPTVQQSVSAGADLTCFSGDKMLGGVQAGLIVGRKDLIAKIKKNPLFRTVRVDKIVFSMLENLLTIYLNGTHRTDIKLWEILSVPEAELYRRAKAILQQVGAPAGVTAEATRAYVGGGALPEASLPSVGIVFANTHKAPLLLKRLRQLPVPVIGRIEHDRLILDLKAIDEGDLAVLAHAVKKIIG